MRCLIVCAALSLISSLAMAEPQIGKVVQPQYDGATGTRAVANAADEALRPDNTVFEQETVKTPHDGSTVLEFVDTTRISIGHDSYVKLDSFVYDDKAKTTESVFNMTKGFFRFVGGSAKEKNVVLKTPTLSLSVRGTAVAIYVGDDGSSVLGMEEGSGSLSTCAGGTPIDLNAGQAVRVSASCKGADQIAMSEVPTDATTSSPGSGTAGPNPTRSASSTAPGGAAASAGESGSTTANGGPNSTSPGRGDPDHDHDRGDPGEGSE